MPTDQGQLFFEDNGQTIHMLDVPIELCRHSRFNTRKTRAEKDIQKLAERIRMNGFERTRALWAVAVNEHYEVFAGGTRLEAAKLAELKVIPSMLHVGYSDEDISRRADLDNLFDEYHTEVSPVDIWAEYARLRDEEKWIQDRIAKTKSEHKSRVSERLKWHDELPAWIKERVGTDYDVGRKSSNKFFTEGHIREITRLVPTLELADWLSADQAWLELAQKAVHDKSKNGEKSVKAVREDVETWKEFVDRAAKAYEELNTYPKKAWNLDGDEPVEIDDDPCQQFIQELNKRKARSLAHVSAAEAAVKTRISKAMKAYEQWLIHRNTEAAQAAARAEAEQLLLAKFFLGDSVAALQGWQGEPIRLLLTDPAYGVEYRTHRRWMTRAPDQIPGDGVLEAMPLLEAAIGSAVPHLAEEAHVLVFCACDRQQEVKDILGRCGLTVKEHDLVWVKEEHTAGDVKGSYGPSHEHLIHAVKGSPEVTPRLRDVFTVARTKETSHPHEKPLALLQDIIRTTTNEGDLVVDPFAGCASTLVAALKLNREFWGAEIEQKYHDEGTTRLLKAWEATCT